MGEATREALYLVDADAHVTRLLRRFLGESYTVESFADGYAALDRVRAAPPAVLITEVLVPQLDGLTLCRLVKADPITSQVRVLVFSMLAADDRARSSGADAFLGKPLERGRLLDSLRIITTQRASSPPRPRAP